MEAPRKSNDLSDSDTESSFSESFAGSLSARSEEPCSFTPRPALNIARRPVVPGLNLKPPKPQQDSSPHTSTRSPSRRLSLSRRSSQTAYAVELLADAVMLPSLGLTDAPRLEAARKGVVAQFGVDAGELTFYELRELRKEEDLAPSGSGQAAGARRLAVRVAKSCFTMAAMEQVLKRSRQLEEEAEAGSAARRAVEGRAAEAQRGLQEAQQHSAEQDAEIGRLQEHCQQLEASNQGLRQQVAHSEAMRGRAQGALDALRSEFEALTRELEGGRLPPGAAPGRGPLPPGGELIGSWVAKSSPRTLARGAEAERTLTRLAAVLDRLGEEPVLHRLEACLQRLGAAPRTPPPLPRV